LEKVVHEATSLANFKAAEDHHLVGSTIEHCSKPIKMEKAWCQVPGFTIWLNIVYNNEPEEVTGRFGDLRVLHKDSSSAEVLKLSIAVDEVFMLVKTLYKRAMLWLDLPVFH